MDIGYSFKKAVDGVDDWFVQELKKQGYRWSGSGRSVYKVITSYVYKDKIAGKAVLRIFRTASFL